MERQHLQAIMGNRNSDSKKLKLDLKQCLLKGGRARGSRELELDLAQADIDAETFEWLGSGVKIERLVLSLMPSQVFMAFKYARSVSQSIELS